MPVTSLLTSLENFNGSPTFVSNNSRYGGGQGASQNTDIIREGSGSGGRRADNTTTGGLGTSFTAADLSKANTHLKMWVFVTQWASVNSLGIVIASGSASSAGDIHTLPTAEFPVNGGFIPVWVDVSRAADSGGPANEAAINEAGVQVNIGDVGGNAQNIIIDEILYGDSGLRWSGTGGAFSDFRSFEDTNAVGCLNTINGVDFLNARIEITTAAALGTVFSDSNFTIVSPDQGLVSSTFMGISVDLTNSGTTVAWTGGTLQSSNVTGATNRPDLLVTNSSGAFNLTNCNILGARLAQFTSGVTFDGGILDALSITQAGANIKNCSINTRSASGVACFTDTDPTFGSTTGIHDVTFMQEGSGHAFELTTVNGSVTLTNIQFDGYGADTTNSAAVYVSAATGTTTINISGGDTPTVRSAGATVAINNAVTVKVTALDADTLNPIQNARVLLEADTGGPLSAGTDILSGVTNASGIIQDTGFNFTSNQPVTGRVRRATASDGTLYKQGTITGTITSAGFETTVILIKDE